MNNQIIEIEKKIELLESDITDYQKGISDKKAELQSFELDNDDFEDSYCEMLDECYEPFMGTYSPSQVLRAVDPTAYRCGLNDYVSSIDVTDSPEYRELENELSELEDELSDLENELSELEDELSELEDELEELSDLNDQDTTKEGE